MVKKTILAVVTVVILACTISTPTQPAAYHTDHKRASDIVITHPRPIDGGVMKYESEKK